jgi:hypothetical protein
VLASRNPKEQYYLGFQKNNQSPEPGLPLRAAATDFGN